MRFPFWLAILFAAFVGLLSPCNAQATRTWVSGVGDDANPCSRTSACKTFAGAISKTASQGEINCLDPGGFGALTITKPLSIICDSVSNGGVLVAGTNGITVNLPSTGGNVVLSGLDFEGIGPGGSAGINGVSMIGYGRLTVRNSTIRDFASAGVNLAGQTGARVYIVDSLMSNNNIGVSAAPAAGTANYATLIRCVVDTNLASAVRANGSAVKVTLEYSQLTGSPAAIDTAGSSATVISVGPSNLLTGSGTPTMIQAFQ